MNKKPNYGIILTVALAGLTLGCASPYGKADLFGGYQDSAVEPSVHRVSFAGNMYISEKRVQIYTIYRCAELTVEKGCNYFVFIEGQSNKDYNTGAGLLPLLVDATRTKKGHSLAETTRLLLKGEEPIGLEKPFLGMSNEHVSSALIRIFTDKPEQYADAFTAKEVLAKLGPEVKGRKSR